MRRSLEAGVDFDASVYAEVFEPVCAHCGEDLEVVGYLRPCGCPGAMQALQAEEAAGRALAQQTMNDLHEQHRQRLRAEREARRDGRGQQP